MVIDTWKSTGTFSFALFRARVMFCEHQRSGYYMPRPTESDNFSRCFSREISTMRFVSKLHILIISYVSRYIKRTKYVGCKYDVVTWTRLSIWGPVPPNRYTTPGQRCENRIIKIIVFFFVLFLHFPKWSGIGHTQHIPNTIQAIFFFFF